MPVRKGGVIHHLFVQMKGQVMSKGKPIVTFRFPEGFIEDLDIRIAEANDRRKGDPWTRTAFIITAIVEKLNKMERSNKSDRTWDVADYCEE
jgi:hypothetical protein